MFLELLQHISGDFHRLTHLFLVIPPLWSAWIGKGKPMTYWLLPGLNSLVSMSWTWCTSLQCNLITGSSLKSVRCLLTNSAYCGRSRHLLPVDPQFPLEGIPISLGCLLLDAWKCGVQIKGNSTFLSLGSDWNVFSYLVDFLVFFSADNLLYDLSFSSHQSQREHTYNRIYLKRHKKLHLGHFFCRSSS